MRSHKLTKAPRSIIAIKTTIVESVSSLNLLNPFSPFPFGIQGQLAFLSSDKARCVVLSGRAALDVDTAVCVAMVLIVRVGKAVAAVTQSSARVLGNMMDRELMQDWGQTVTAENPEYLEKLFTEKKITPCYEHKPKETIPDAEGNPLQPLYVRNREEAEKLTTQEAFRFRMTVLAIQRYC